MMSVVVAVVESDGGISYIVRISPPSRQRRGDKAWRGDKADDPWRGDSVMQVR